jgi:intracellular septation protein A
MMSNHWSTRPPNAATALLIVAGAAFVAIVLAMSTSLLKLGLLAIDVAVLVGLTPFILGRRRAAATKNEEEPGASGRQR